MFFIVDADIKVTKKGHIYGLGDESIGILFETKVEKGIYCFIRIIDL